MTKTSELKGKASEISSKLVSEENKAKAKSFANSLLIGFLKGTKWFITALYEKVLPSVNNALERRLQAEQSYEQFCEASQAAQSTEQTAQIPSEKPAEPAAVESAENTTASGTENAEQKDSK